MVNKANVFPKLKPYRMNRKEYEKAVASGAGGLLKRKRGRSLRKWKRGNLRN